MKVWSTYLLHDIDVCVTENFTRAVQLPVEYKPSFWKPPSCGISDVACLFHENKI
jgi:hypothetical protein